MDGWPVERHLETLFFTMTMATAQRPGARERPLGRDSSSGGLGVNPVW
jgi:hypothetical protein